MLRKVKNIKSLYLLGNVKCDRSSSKKLQKPLVHKCLRLASSDSSDNRSSQDLPQAAQVVICGGGVIGCSVAYHLARQGWTDVIVLEQGR